MLATESSTIETFRNQLLTNLNLQSCKFRSKLNLISDDLCRIYSHYDVRGSGSTCSVARCSTYLCNNG